MRGHTHQHIVLEAVAEAAVAARHVLDAGVDLVVDQRELPRQIVEEIMRGRHLIANSF